MQMTEAISYFTYS